MPQRVASTLVESKAVPQRGEGNDAQDAAKQKSAIPADKVATATSPSTQETKEKKEDAKSSLAAFVSSAAERGYSPAKLARLCSRIDALQKKYNLDYEELAAKFQETGKEFNSKSRELEAIRREIEVTKKNQGELLKKYYVEEKQVQDYVEAKDALNQFGVDMDKLSGVKGFLIGLKKSNYDPAVVIEKLKAIGDLESRRGTLQSEINVLSGELRAKKTLLMQLRRMQETGLGVAQMERIRDIVAKISSGHGINPEESFSRFEQDVLKYYNVVLGLETEVEMLTENKEALNREWDVKLAGLEEKEKALLENNRKLEEKFESNGEVIKAYRELVTNGVGEEKILAWEKLIRESGIASEVLDREIRECGNLSSVESETKTRIGELEARKNELEVTLSELSTKQKAVEESLAKFQETSMAQIESTSSKVISSILDARKEAELATQQSKTDLGAMLGDLSKSASDVSTELKGALRELEPQLKNVSQAIEAARLIGKYEAVLPILKLADTSQPYSRMNETEAMIAMWNLSNIFNAWLGNHSTGGKKEIRELLRDVIEAIDSEIQRVGTQSG